MFQREKLKALMGPLMQMLLNVAPDAEKDDLALIGVKIIETAPAIVNCLNGSEQFPPKDPNQLELPI